MRNIYKVFVLAALLTTQYAFADDTMPPPDDAKDKPCLIIAKACSEAGFVRERSETKGIWRNCMEPVLLGQTVAGVKVDPAAVKTCRSHKIDEMQMQLKKFKQVQ
jgi:hypothetical protein